MGYRGRMVPLSAPRCQTGKTKQHRGRVRMYLARKKKEERKLKLVVGRKPSSSPAMGYRGRMVPLSAPRCQTGITKQLLVVGRIPSSSPAMGYRGRVAPSLHPDAKLGKQNRTEAGYPGTWPGIKKENNK